MRNNEIFLSQVIIEKLQLRFESIVTVVTKNYMIQQNLTKNFYFYFFFI